jgi:flagellar biosynthetic protein FliR
METILQLLPNFLLIFCRISAFFMVSPIFSARGVPGQFKIGIIFFISLITYTTLGMESSSWDSTYVLSIIRELLVGILLGYIAYLFFTVVQVAGSFVDMQMGFGIANVIDPMTGTQSPILGNFKFFIAVLLFLAINGHHYLITGIMDSYQWVPISNSLFSHIYSGDISDFLLTSFTVMFSLAFQMAAPLIVALFLVDVAMGILAKTAPQFNIFVIGIPLKILIGFFILLIMIPGFLFLFQEVFETLFKSLRELITIIGK